MFFSQRSWGFGLVNFAGKADSPTFSRGELGTLTEIGGVLHGAWQCLYGGDNWSIGFSWSYTHTCFPWPACIRY